MLVEWPGNASVIPEVGGSPQYHCARRSSTALLSARSPLAENPSLRHFADSTKPIYIGESLRAPVVDAVVFEDVNRPEDIERLGISWQLGGPNEGAVSAK